MWRVSCPICSLNSLPQVADTEITDTAECPYKLPSNFADIRIFSHMVSRKAANKSVSIMQPMFCKQSGDKMAGEKGQNVLNTGKYNSDFASSAFWKCLGLKLGT